MNAPFRLALAVLGLGALLGGGPVAAQSAKQPAAAKLPVPTLGGLTTFPLDPTKTPVGPGTRSPGPPAPAAAAAPSAFITLPSPMTSDPATTGHTGERPAKPGGDLAFGAFQRGYYATALQEAMKRLKANPKDGAAMALVAEIYTQGLAVRPNPAEAAKWNRLASQQGNREATFSYAMALVRGEGVPKDKAAAAALFRTAAAQGHAGALYNLGVMALEGDGTTRDFGLAASWFRQAAEAGDVDALFALATLTQNGRGVALDLPKAAGLMKQAADQGHVGAQVEYAIMLFNGQGVAKDETGAARYFAKAAAQGNPVAANRLARIYAAGRGLPKDLVEAAHYHIMARAAGVSDGWLDDQIKALTPAQRGQVEDAVRRQIAP